MTTQYFIYSSKLQSSSNFLIKDHTSTHSKNNLIKYFQSKCPIFNNPSLCNNSYLPSTAQQQFCPTEFLISYLLAMSNPVSTSAMLSNSCTISWSTAVRYSSPGGQLGTRAVTAGIQTTGGGGARGTPPIGWMPTACCCCKPAWPGFT